MQKFSTQQAALSRTLLAIIVVVIIIIAGAGAAIYLSSTPSSSTTTPTTTSVSTTSSSTGTSISTTGAATGAPINIGLPASLTGYASPFGTSCAKGVQATVAQINATGGVNGSPIKLFEIDDQSTAQQGSTVGTQLLTEDHVVGVISCSTDEPLLAMAPEFDQAHVALIDSFSGGSQVTINNPAVFKLELDSSVLGMAAAKYLAGTLGIKKIAILQNDQDYTNLAVQGFKSAIGNYSGAQIVFQAPPTPVGTSDYSTYVTEIQQSGAQGVFLALFPPDAPTAINQIRAAGLNVSMFSGPTTDAGGNSSSTNVSYGIAKSNLNGVYWPTLFQQNSSNAQAFISLYQSKWGTIPDFFAAFGHDATQVMVDAIKQSGTSPSAILAAIPNIHDNTLLTGPLNGFLPDHRRVIPVTVVQWENGYTHIVAVYDTPNIITPLPLPTTATSTAVTSTTSS